MPSSTPRATYRVQLCRDFGFEGAARIAPYLAALGISTLYCSPVLQAREGSTHGYDTTDATRLSGELGGERGWKALCASAREHGLSILLDIVPNHMAASIGNPWWRDILEHGRVSPWADMFDIDWEPTATRLRNRVLLPVLTTSLTEAIAEGKITADLTESGLVCRYGTLELPLNVRSYRLIMAPLLDLPSGAIPEPLLSLIRSLPTLLAVDDMPGTTPDVQYSLCNEMKTGLLDIVASQSAAANYRNLHILVRELAHNLPGQQISRLLQEQCYVLEHWRQGRHTVNYRRFFDINDLAGVRMEDERVFEYRHGILPELARSRVVCGFRVDHVDGLRQPLQYLKRLRRIRTSSLEDSTLHTPYIIVEKILSGDEALPTDWSVDGTTGYEFLTQGIGLFIAPLGLADMQRQHRKTTRTRTTRLKLTYANKRKVLTQLFRSDLSRLANRLAPVAQWLYPSSNISARQLVGAIADATAFLPVYRTYYSGSGGLSTADQGYIESALGMAAKQPAALKYPLAGDVIRRALTLDIPDSAPAPVRRAMRTHLLRWQQLTGAAMAKGFEDTTLYQDSVLLALNDVGGDHTLHGTSVADFHCWNAERLRLWPHTMNCTATHDTKRGEDVRARLAVLSEIPGDWNTAVNRWILSLKQEEATGRLVGRIDTATHLFLLQTIVGAWPESNDMRSYADRLIEYMVKVAREAKTHSSWLEPSEDYESALAELIGFILEGEGAPRFHECFGPVIATLRFHGLVNSIAQVLLKTTCPGLPDFYQGTELLDLSLVDPDNRRQVDYLERESLLREVAACESDPLSEVSRLTDNWPDARAKLYVTARALHLRATQADVFQKGDYVPLHADGARRDQVCAFMRNHRGTHIAVVVPLRSRTVAGNCHLPLGSDVWSSDSLRVPHGFPQIYEDAFTGLHITAKAGRLRLADVFARFPVSILVSRRM
ncbi:MAG: malto-oligosyltrehalose synthase [Dehalococcoidia bacterium]|nr:malto-oligosyltrehalose synthase [Dehalococcoidia bacterium]